MIRSIRRKPRNRKTVVRLKGKAKTDLRRDVYYRANGYCELKLSPKCWKWAGWEHGHLCHYPKSVGAGAGDTMKETKWGCVECHIGWEHNGGKPCPAKPGMEAK